MKFQWATVGAMLALLLTGCASNYYAPYPAVATARADCSATRRMAGQRCEVVQGEAQKRQLLRQLGMR